MSAMEYSVFHEGELLLQQQAGSRARLAEVGARLIRDHMPQQHREFFEQLPFLVLGGVDAQDQPWASMLAGAPGFASSPDPKRLVVRARPLPHDPLAGALVAGAAIGLLGIEPHTRRRNRLNGSVIQSDENGFVIEVSQSFGNCPKYIQARKPEFTGVARVNAIAAHRMDALDDAACSLIARADTFFIATAHPSAGGDASLAFGVDVSHRGGKPGFVRVDTQGCLTVPDFIGNSYFNTLGNLLLNPRCGLLFIDFDRRDLLHVAARGQIFADGSQAAFRGAQRLLRLQPLSVLHVGASLPLRWGTMQLSPALENIGDWGH